jgi:hypothetical protein
MAVGLGLGEYAVARHAVHAAQIASKKAGPRDLKEPGSFIFFFF